MTEWDIQSRSHACTGCRQGFADKQAYHTLLSFGADGYQRRDLCAACFLQANREGVLSYWQGEYKVPPPPPPEAIQKDTAETLLRKLVAANDPAQAGACYILAVMLERKRILKHAGRGRQGFVGVRARADRRVVHGAGSGIAAGSASGCAAAGCGFAPTGVENRGSRTREGFGCSEYCELTRRCAATAILLLFQYEPRHSPCGHGCVLRFC